jgi:hypothetical protein
MMNNICERDSSLPQALPSEPGGWKPVNQRQRKRTREMAFRNSRAIVLMHSEHAHGKHSCFGQQHVLVKPMLTINSMSSLSNMLTINSMPLLSLLIPSAAARRFARHCAVTAQSDFEAVGPEIIRVAPRVQPRLFD